MSILASHITNRELMADTGLNTFIDHYSSMHFGPFFHNLMTKERGLTRSLRQGIWSISERHGDHRFITFKTEVDKIPGTYSGTNYYPEVVEHYNADMVQIQQRMIAWAIAVMAEYKEDATWNDSGRDQHFPDFEDNVFCDYDVVRDYRGEELIVPTFRFRVPRDWEDYNTAKKQQLTRAITSMIWRFRHGLKGPFMSSLVHDRLEQAGQFLAEWRKDELAEQEKMREQRLEESPTLHHASPESFA